MQVDVPAGKHRLVSLAVMEAYVRYNKVVAQNPALLNRILATFLGDHGMSHADAVRFLPAEIGGTYTSYPYKHILHRAHKCKMTVHLNLVLPGWVH